MQGWIRIDSKNIGKNTVQRNMQEYKETTQEYLSRSDFSQDTERERETSLYYKETHILTYKIQSQMNIQREKDTETYRLTVEFRKTDALREIILL